MRQNLEKTAIHQSLIQPILILGVEREMLILTAGFAFLIPFSTYTIFGLALSAILGFMFWFVVIGLLKKASTADNDFRKIFSRFIGYKKYYRAHSDFMSIDRIQKSAYDTK